MKATTASEATATEEIETANIISSSSTAAFASSSSLGAISTATARLNELGINFVALDFDLTILDCHTGGRWNGSLEALMSHVRPVFWQWIPVLQAAKIEVAVVTFSEQTHLVRGVLDTIMQSEHTRKGTTTPYKCPSGRIPIRGKDRSWSYTGKGSRAGKQPYMASAADELEVRFDVRISRASSLLIDDDNRNVAAALQSGCRAIWLNPQKPHHMLQEVIKLK